MNTLLLVTSSSPSECSSFSDYSSPSDLARSGGLCGLGGVLWIRDGQEGSSEGLSDLLRLYTDSAKRDNVMGLQNLSTTF